MASIKLTDFKSNVADLARPNRFLVQFLDEDWDDNFAFYVKSASLPERTIGNIELNWQGMKAKIAGDPTFADFTMTFLNDYDFDVKNYIEEWLELIANMSSNERTAHEDYKVDITITQLGRTSEEVLAEYNLIGCFPLTMDAIELSSDSTDAIEELSVTFAVDQFTRSDDSGISQEA